MDITTLIGVFGGMATIIIGIFLTGADPTMYIDLPSVFITVGGTTMAMFTAFPMKQLLVIPKLLGIAFFNKTGTVSHGEMIETLVTFSEKARREGLLALEDDVDEVPDPFLQKGIQLVVDGTDPELVKNILMTELNNIENRHGKGVEMMELAASIAPAFGMIGTLIGLILMLRNLEDKTMLGVGMSAALITTMYGSILANWFFTPIAAKLANKDKEELLLKEIMIEGTLSIQSGDNPRIVLDKLKSYLAPDVREKLASDEGEI